MDNNTPLYQQIERGELHLLPLDKTYNDFGDEVRSRNVISKKITSIKKGTKARKRISVAQKMEAQIDYLDKKVGDGSKMIAKTAQKSKQNHFASLRRK